jgi:DNA-binding NarL/FixJ family response regulator
MTRVLIADDHSLFRAGLRRFLADSLASVEIGEAATGNATLECVQQKDWDLLVLDINMPDRGGLDILRHVRSTRPGIRVLVLSGYPARQYAVNVLRAGAAGYIGKDSEPEELLKAVLSEREFQIFGKLAAGRGVSEIGRELCLSVKTVSTYRSRILEKMHMKSNADLTSYALRNEIIQ